MINLIDDEEWREWSPGYWFSSHGKHASQWTKGQNSHIDPNKWTIAKDKPKPDNRKGYKGGYIPNDIYPFKDNPSKNAKHMTSSAQAKARTPHSGKPGMSQKFCIRPTPRSGHAILL